MKSIITKLIIYKKDPRFYYCPLALLLRGILCRRRTMAEIKITKCKSCGASITWIKTKNGRVMPCDVPAVDYQENYKGTDTVVTDDGRVLRVMIFKNPSPSGLQPIIDGKGYISHFATCPYANKYRRRDND